MVVVSPLPVMVVANVVSVTLKCSVKSVGHMFNSSTLDYKYNYY